MLFSIIVPVYNVGKYIDQCIESIVAQEEKDFELILVDDGSTDHSPAICDKWAADDARIQVIHKKNGGLSSARNIGSKAATGEYVLYIDSDDYISETLFLSKLAKKILTTHADVIVYKFKKFYDARNQFDECSYSFPDLGKYKGLAEKVAYLVKTDSFYCSAWSKAIKRSVLVDNNIEFETGLLGEDQEWYYHVLTNIQSLDGVNESFLVYRQRADSITKSWKIKNLTDCIYVVRKWAEAIKQSGHLDCKYRIALLNSVAKLYCNLLIAYSRFSDSRKKAYYGQLKELSDLLNYDMNPRVHKIRQAKRIAGFHGLMMILALISRVR